ncbi:hypothetical protein CKM354_000929000 [Cercospora kikuchii]|uniref:Uncharacterized protein n=1 Tax=Cercospora kikuchii TaxID=84275 RepID=A0A9P3CP35_9PEZI|nr:uncharacterized protein CKM354_000929000 [Cercospora kikuchii]GIZ46151.1 hypothetical protein CKM354_000929000 [Cercospora kikuchii]
MVSAGSPDRGQRLHNTCTVGTSESSKMSYIKAEPVEDNGGYYRWPEYHQPPVSTSLHQLSVKTEPTYRYLNNQREHIAQRAPVLAYVSPAQGGQLSARSLQVQRAKRSSNRTNSLVVDVFETTGMIVRPAGCVKVTQMLLDTGASSSFISATAVRQAGLTIINCEPISFEQADGSLNTHFQKVEFKLYMAGVHAKVTAYIDYGNSSHHMLLGKPAIKAFNSYPNFSFGRKKETRWYISQDVTGLRGKRVLLLQDPAYGTPTLVTYGAEEGLRLAERKGETGRQRTNREIIERAKERYQALYKKYA